MDHGTTLIVSFALQDVYFQPSFVNCDYSSAHFVTDLMSTQVNWNACASNALPDFNPNQGGHQECNSTDSYSSLPPPTHRPHTHSSEFQYGYEIQNSGEGVGTQGNEWPSEENGGSAIDDRATNLSTSYHLTLLLNAKTNQPPSYRCQNTPSQGAVNNLTESRWKTFDSAAMNIRSYTQPPSNLNNYTSNSHYSNFPQTTNHQSGGTVRTMYNLTQHRLKKPVLGEITMNQMTRNCTNPTNHYCSTLSEDTNNFPTPSLTIHNPQSEPYLETHDLKKVTMGSFQQPSGDCGYPPNPYYSTSTHPVLHPTSFHHTIATPQPRPSLETPDLSRSTRGQPGVCNYHPNSSKSAPPPPPPPPTYDSLILPPTVNTQPAQADQAIAQGQYEVKTVKRGRKRKMTYGSLEEEKTIKKEVQRDRDKVYNDSLKEAIKNLGLILPNMPPNASKKRIIRSAIERIIELENLVGSVHKSKVENTLLSCHHNHTLVSQILNSKSLLN
ncbi:hypothetical protein ACTXT7_001993 [Hymenolepis weldensis]